MPLSLLAVGVAVLVFFRMNAGGQFDDDEGPAWSVLMDDDRAPAADERATNVPAQAVPAMADAIASDAAAERTGAAEKTPSPASAAPPGGSVGVGKAARQPVTTPATTRRDRAPLDADQGARGRSDRPLPKP